uniref:Uncharacterized protein n=1 Tax=Anguilla anguilla TaxID=7936 RepID=A0A0E9S239_ANGAN
MQFLIPRTNHVHCLSEVKLRTCSQTMNSHRMFRAYTSGLSRFWPPPAWQVMLPVLQRHGAHS